MNPVVLDKIGELIWKVREDAGLTRTALAELAGCDRSMIFLIEKDRRGMTMEFLEKIANALGLSRRELFMRHIERRYNVGKNSKLYQVMNDMLVELEKR